MNRYYPGDRYITSQKLKVPFDTISIDGEAFLFPTAFITPEDL
ncbi:hypothetical protein [Paenibacillus antibioticophila]|nr:hypothetical protein [Paenibacillus antibioticophila]